jgi:hypothetical protein
VRALPSPAAAGIVPLTTGGWLALASTLLVIVLGFVGLRPLLVARLGVRGSPAAGGGGGAAALVLVALAGLVWLANPYAAGVLVPAAHLWLLASAPGSRLRGPIGVAAVLGGLLAPLAVVLVYALAWGLGPVEGVWSAYGLVAGGVLGWGAALALCTLAATLCATVIVLRTGGRAAAAAPAERIVTRGPRSYAGPGSLGGTESALRQ